MRNTVPPKLSVEHVTVMRSEEANVKAGTSMLEPKKTLTKLRPVAPNSDGCLVQNDFPPCNTTAATDTTHRKTAQ